MNHAANHRRPSFGLSLLELIAALTIIAFIASIALPRASDSTQSGSRTACHVNRAEIEVQARLWKRATGSFPAANLADIGADLSYFPEGVPTCPLDGTTYTIDSSTGLVVGHDH